ncbi:hypothetical protein PACTADRAFT_49296 [Pachysolen tannophilus NRRL Y-2460]|uniref:Precorrin-2 dehydrogenase n=1 Tax=Pachysolen tannophilus NRRL Y-2460 TaxID=669874 RepID=A0A1E4TVP2_PACTA|nr:hypothetical protein PACTADRAFT_49296 [Pachysolen tannophilus NRRL Y-2460]
MTNLLASLCCKGEVHLVVGVSVLSAFRINSILESGARPVLVSSKKIDEKFPANLQEQIDNGRVSWVSRDFGEKDLITLGRQEVDHIVDKVFVTLTFKDYNFKKNIFQKCQKLRIPINIADHPEFCTFTLLSTYNKGDFQLGITTSGKGCKLASKIKRELVNALPQNIDEICNKVGELREKIQKEDNGYLDNLKNEQEAEILGDNEEDSIQTFKLNKLIHEFEMTEKDKKYQRARWLAQIVEYYPLKKLASLSIEDLSCAYQDDNEQPSAQVSLKKGTISLVGSGPGAVSLLTLGALSEIYSADLVLSDKLVPEQVLELIPRTTETFIARKFPGNAEMAQKELLDKGLAALNQGKKVIRLKQGDPYIFGRGGEEYNFFKENGFEPVVLPGLTSALAAPVMAQIPITHREVSDQVLILTGTGRKGVLPDLPFYNKTQTCVFLMSLHRLNQLTDVLIAERNWDPKLPCCIIERASCPDQRIIRSNLQNIYEAYETCGSRPPGLLVTGWACEVISDKNDYHNYNSKKWIVEEGCGEFDDKDSVSGLQNIISSLQTAH